MDIKKWKWTICTGWLFLLFSCNNNDQVFTPGKKTTAYFADYRIKAEEGNDYVSCLFRFRKGGLDAEPVILKAPAYIKFDDEVLSADSAGLSGAYYELLVPFLNFPGRHTIEYGDVSGKIHKETFDFAPFTLKKEMPEMLHRNDWHFEMEGLQNHAAIAVLATDTAFMSNDLNRIDTVRENILHIPASDLGELANGPIFLSLHHEQKRRLADPPGGGGRLLISYGLKRQFILVD